MVVVNSNNDESGKKDHLGSSGRYPRWDRVTHDYIKKPLLWFVTAIALISARNPIRTLSLLGGLSIVLIITGFLTNFRLVADGEELWAPKGTRNLQHGTWLRDDSGFPVGNNGYLAFLVHKNGENVLTVEGANCLFDAVDIIRSVDGYHSECYDSWGDEDTVKDEAECLFLSASALFNNNRTEFWSSMNVPSDRMVQLLFSRLDYPSGAPVVRETIFGYPYPTIPTNASLINQFTKPGDIILQSSTAFLGLIPKSETDKYLFEYDAVKALYKLQDVWDRDGVQCVIEANSFRGLDDETQRGVQKDIPMMAAAFIIMMVFCALYLSNFKNLIKSRAILGVGAVFTIFFSIMASYGLMFIIGVPFTGMAQLFFYVMVGIGLDDTFIITGAYARTDPRKESVQRIEECMNEIGISICLSTITTVVAFFLGIASAMPMIKWFCMYAAPTVLIDFFYQISFFIAIMVLDDRRIKDGRYDCLVCIKARKSLSAVEEDAHPEEDGEAQPIIPLDGPTWPSRFMARFSEALLRPPVQALVIVSFSVLLGLGIYGSTQQKQQMDFRDMMPPDSFIRTYYGALHKYSSEYSYGLLFLRGHAYFRDVDVSDPEIQRQMEDFVNDLVDMPYISSQPEYFWLRHFKMFEDILGNYTDTSTWTFNDKMDLFLSTPPFDVLYSNDIVRDSDGVVTASRCELIFDKGSNYDIQVQIDTVKEQKRVTSLQPINQGKNDWPFFMFTKHFYAWELHALMFRDLVLTLVLGLASVFVIALMFIPHPFWAFSLTFIVAAVYCEILAFLNVVGIHISVVSGIGLVMSIGLVVDYNTHVALAYHETMNSEMSRTETARRVLTTMGASICVGGVTTIVSALPLGLTDSLAFQTFFYTFLAIPVLGVAHGLILLPVILSLCGPHVSSEFHVPKTSEASSGSDANLRTQVSSTGTEVPSVLPPPIETFPPDTKAPGSEAVTPVTEEIRADIEAPGNETATLATEALPTDLEARSEKATLATKEVPTVTEAPENDTLTLENEARTTDTEAPSETALPTAEESVDETTPAAAFETVPDTATPGNESLSVDNGAGEDAEDIHSIVEC